MRDQKKIYLLSEANDCARKVSANGGWAISEIHTTLPHEMFKNLEMILLRKWNIRIIELPEQTFCIMLLTNYNKKHAEKIVKKAIVSQYDEKVKKELKEEAVTRKLIFDFLL